MSAAAARRPEIAEETIWHDVECGGYTADLPLWRELAAAAAGPVLELGCGTGRVALELARRGIEITAVDTSPALLEEIGRRAAAGNLEVELLLADARELSLDRRYALVLAPMQLVHLLEGAEGRAALLRRARAHLAPGGALALALLAERIDPALNGDPALPDVAERGGWVYSSQPIEARRTGGGIEVRRLRQRVSPAGELTESLDVVFLDDLDPATLEAEAAPFGFEPRERIEVPPTPDHVGSTVVVLEAGV